MGLDETDLTDEKQWEQLEAAETVQQYVNGWLMLQVAQLGKVTEATVLFKSTDTNEWSQVATIPQQLAHPSKELSDCIKTSIKQQKGVLKKAAENETVNIAYPLMIEEQLIGVVGFNVSDLKQSFLPLLMRRLQWGMFVLENFYKRTQQQGTQSVQQEERALQVLKVVATAIETEGLQNACNLVVNELATQFSLERVYLGKQAKNHDFQLVSVSHKIELDHRTRLTQAVYAVMDEVVNFQSTIHLNQQNKKELDWPFPAHEELLNSQECHSICSLPLVVDGQVFGALVLQSTQNIDEESIQALEAITVLLAPIMQQKALEERSIGHKLLAEIKAGAHRIFGPENMTTKVFSLVFIGICYVLLFIPIQFKVTSDAILEGSIQRSVVASVDGYISKSWVSAGDFVTKGQPLFKLDEKDLILEKQNWLSQKQQYYRQYREALAKGARSQVNILKAQLGQADSQLALIEEKISKVLGSAPFDGIVVSGDLNQMLGAPVSKGDVLFEIAPLKSYRLIIEIDERDINDIKEKQQGVLVLSSASEKPLAFQVNKITPISNSHDGGNFFRVESSLLDTPDFLRPGMKGIAKVNIEPRNIVWVWTHNLVNRLRLWFWRWLP